MAGGAFIDSSGRMLIDADGKARGCCCGGCLATGCGSPPDFIGPRILRLTFSGATVDMGCGNDGATFSVKITCALPDGTYDLICVDQFGLDSGDWQLTVTGLSCGNIWTGTLDCTGAPSQVYDTLLITARLSPTVPETGKIRIEAFLEPHVIGDPTTGSGPAQTYLEDIALSICPADFVSGTGNFGGTSPGTVSGTFIP